MRSHRARHYRRRNVLPSELRPVLISVRVAPGASPLRFRARSRR